MDRAGHARPRHGARAHGGGRAGSDAPRTQAFLETLSFRAVGFYEKPGYTAFSRIDGFPPGGARHALRKTLGADPLSA